MKILFFTFIIFCFMSCDKDDEKIYLNVTDIELIDIGQVNSDLEFNAVPVKNGLQRCRIKTIGIKKENSIETLTACIQGKDLKINVVATPHDFDCNDESCLTMHELFFNLELPKESGEYNVILRINGGVGPGAEFKYKFLPYDGPSI